MRSSKRNYILHFFLKTYLAFVGGCDEKPHNIIHKILKLKTKNEMKNKNNFCWCRKRATIFCQIKKAWYDYKYFTDSLEKPKS